MWFQNEVSLRARERGFHLVTEEIVSLVPEISSVKIGILNILLKHTSASITLNENADPSVRDDFDSFFNRLIPENQSYYTHIYEGSDDLPAHIKSSLLGNSLSIPITDGRLNLGTWQGIYLCEHRNRGGKRILVVTINGE
jgi:secondary thiamine-phosphate synthase enzyme